MEKLVGYEASILENELLSVQINLLNQCTSRCKSCRKYTWPSNVLSFDKLKETLMTLKLMGLKTIVFSGGDPILYPFFEELMHFCFSNEIEFSLITTLLLKNDDLMKKIAEYAKRIHVSLDSLNEEDYKEIRGVDGLDLVLSNMKLISKNSEINKIRISSTISRMNFKDVSYLALFAQSKGYDINLYLVHTWEDLEMYPSQFEKFYYLVSSYANIISNSESILRERFTKEKPATICGINKIHCLIDSDGSIYPCCKLLNDNGEYDESKKFSYGNIYEDDIANAFIRRFAKSYPLNCGLCQECSPRYIEMNKHIDKIHKPNSLFI